MKRLRYLLLLSPFLMAMTCDEDPNFPKFGIDGVWYLVNITDVEDATSTDFDRGLIRWDFDEIYRSMYVSNNNTTDVYDGPESFVNDNYEFIPVPDVCDNAIIIQDINYGCIEVSNDSLIISNEHNNGTKFILIR